MTTFYTETEICQRFNVTPEQLDRATRILDCQSGKVFYQVTSQTTDGVAYEVRFNAQYRLLTCTCPAGQHGNACWHRRAAMAAAFEYCQAENLQARKEAEEAEAAKAAEEAARRAALDAHFAAREEAWERQREEARTLRSAKNPRGVQNRPFSVLW